MLICVSLRFIPLGVSHLSSYFQGFFYDAPSTLLVCTLNCHKIVNLTILVNFQMHFIVEMRKNIKIMLL